MYGRNSISGTAGRIHIAQRVGFVFHPKPPEEERGNHRAMNKQRSEQRPGNRVAFVEDVERFGHALLAVLARAGIDRCGDHSHFKLRLAQFRHDLRDRVPRRVFVGAHVDSGSVVEPLMDALGEQIDVDGLLVEKRFAGSW